MTCDAPAADSATTFGADVAALTVSIVRGGPVAASSLSDRSVARVQTTLDALLASANAVAATSSNAQDDAR